MTKDPEDIAFLRQNLGKVGESLNDDQLGMVAKQLREVSAYQIPTYDHVREIIKEQLGRASSRDFMMDNSDLDSVLDDILKGLGASGGDSKK